MFEWISKNPLSPDFGTLISCTDHKPITGLDTDSIAQELLQSGAILFRGFADGAHGFEALTEVFSNAFLIDSGYTRQAIPHLGAATLQVRSPNASRFFELHSELASTMPVRPRLVWFYCHEAPIDCGETLVCDGACIFRAFSQETQQFFLANPQVQHTEKQVVPVLMGPPSLRFPAFANSLLAKSTYDEIRTSVQFADGTPIPRGPWEEAKQAAQRHTVSIRWQRGDILMIDNWRCMHGRPPFPEGTIRTLYSRVAMDFQYGDGGQPS